MSSTYAWLSPKLLPWWKRALFWLAVVCAMIVIIYGGAYALYSYENREITQIKCVRMVTDLCKNMKNGQTTYRYNDERVCRKYVMKDKLIRVYAANKMNCL